MPAFLVIFLVVVVRRSRPAAPLARRGAAARSSAPARSTSAACSSAPPIVLALLFGVMDDAWAQATYISLATGVMVLSIVVLTGYAGQISLAQWALAGIGALIAGRLVRAGLPDRAGDPPRRPAHDPGRVWSSRCRRCGPAA